VSIATVWIMAVVWDPAVQLVWLVWLACCLFEEVYRKECSAPGAAAGLFVRYSYLFVTWRNIEGVSGFGSRGWTEVYELLELGDWL